MSARDELQALADELERTAAQLRDEQLPAAEAAAAVERCAELASRLGAELDSRARAAEADPPGQGSLL